MNWEMIGSISEVVGALGVIITLAYLATQIRASTLATHAASRLGVTQDCRQIANLHLDLKVATAFREGLWSYPDMPYEDGILFGTTLANEALFFEGIFAQYESGQLEHETYQSYLTWFASQITTPGGRAWWEDSGRAIFLTRMVTMVDKRLAEENLGDIRKLAQFQRNPDGPSTTIQADATPVDP